MNHGQLKAGIILSYLTIGLNMLIQFIYTPVMIHLLGDSEYGLYTLVGSVVSYLSLFSFGFTGSYLRFYSQRKTNNDIESIRKLNGMFAILFILMAIVSFICGIVLMQFPSKLFGSKLTSGELGIAIKLMFILIINVSISFPSSLLDSMIVAHERFLYQRLINLIGVLINPLIAFPLLIAGYGSVAIVLVTTFITITKFIFNIIYCIKILKIEFDFRHFDFMLLKEIAVFSSFMFLNMVIDQVNWSVDKLILGWVSGTGAVALYSVGAQINSLFISFSTAISSVFAPKINNIAAKNNSNRNNEFTKMMINVGRIQFFILMLVALGFVTFGYYFITELYATKGYGVSYYVALILVIPALVPYIQNTGVEIQRSINKHQIRSVIYFIMAVLNVVISIPLAKKFGPVGSALGTAIGIIIANIIVMNVYYQRGIGLDMKAFWGSIGSLSKGLVIPICFSIIIMEVITFDSVIKYLAFILIYIIVYIISMFRFGLDSSEKLYIINKLNKLYTVFKFH